MSGCWGNAPRVPQAVAARHRGLCTTLGGDALASGRELDHQVVEICSAGRSERACRSALRQQAFALLDGHDIHCAGDDGYRCGGLVADLARLGGHRDCLAFDRRLVRIHAHHPIANQATASKPLWVEDVEHPNRPVPDRCRGGGASSVEEPQHGIDGAIVGGAGVDVQISGISDQTTVKRQVDQYRQAARVVDHDPPVDPPTSIGAQHREPPRHRSRIHAISVPLPRREPIAANECERPGVDPYRTNGGNEAFVVLVSGRTVW
jgi:hypothetical protein